MKNILATLLGGVLLLAAGSPQPARAGIAIGTGNATSHIVIEGFLAGPLLYDVFYSYNASAAPDTFDLLSLVDLEDTNLTLSWVNYGSLAEPNYFLDAIQYGNQTLTNTGFPTFSPYWVQWVSDGKAGFPSATDIAGGSWSFGSGLSRPYRLHAPGSWDAFVYNDGTTAPSTLPVPEPSAAALVGLALLARVAPRRRTRRQ